MIVFLYWWVLIGTLFGCAIIYWKVYEYGWDWLQKDCDLDEIPMPIFKLLFTTLGLLVIIVFLPIILPALLLKIFRS